MVVSNEPGLYKAGQYGIRIENLILVVNAAESEGFGRFYKFETLTLCPYDLRLIDREMLTAEEIGQINDYHRMVRERLNPLLNDAEREWLAARTAAIE